MAVGVHKAGVDLLPGGVKDLLPRQGRQVGGDGRDDPVPQGQVRLVGLGGDRVVERAVFDNHVDGSSSISKMLPLYAEIPPAARQSCPSLKRKGPAGFCPVRRPLPVREALSGRVNRKPLRHKGFFT